MINSFEISHYSERDFAYEDDFWTTDMYTEDVMKMLSVLDSRERMELASCLDEDFRAMNTSGFFVSDFQVYTTLSIGYRDSNQDSYDRYLNYVVPTSFANTIEWIESRL